MVNISTFRLGTVLKILRETKKPESSVQGTWLRGKHRYAKAAKCLSWDSQINSLKNKGQLSN